MTIVHALGLAAGCLVVGAGLGFYFKGLLIAKAEVVLDKVK